VRQAVYDVEERDGGVFVRFDLRTDGAGAAQG
jgi:hypothetical protein